MTHSCHWSLVRVSAPHSTLGEAVTPRAVPNYKLCENRTIRIIQDVRVGPRPEVSDRYTVYAHL
jgi:hypothetical protein